MSVGGLEALKDQLKYLKVVLEIKIKTSGRKGQLEAALINYLNPSKINSLLMQLDNENLLPRSCLEIAFFSLPVTRQ